EPGAGAPPRAAGSVPVGGPSSPGSARPVQRMVDSVEPTPRLVEPPSITAAPQRQGSPAQVFNPGRESAAAPVASPSAVQRAPFTGADSGSPAVGSVDLAGTVSPREAGSLPSDPAIASSEAPGLSGAERGLSSSEALTPGPSPTSLPPFRERGDQQ